MTTSTPGWLIAAKPHNLEKRNHGRRKSDIRGDAKMKYHLFWSAGVSGSVSRMRMARGPFTSNTSTDAPDSST
jgi:hypothetical protein